MMGLTSLNGTNQLGTFLKCSEYEIQHQNTQDGLEGGESGQVLS